MKSDPIICSFGDAGPFAAAGELALAFASDELAPACAPGELVLADNSIVLSIVGGFVAGQLLRPQN